MFGFAWSELGLIASVALILIGPKDLPVAVRTITDLVKKGRRMAAEFQTHIDDMIREVNLHEVRDQITAIRNFDVRGEVERHIDPDHSLRDTFAGNPLEPAPASGAAQALVGEGEVAELEPIAETVAHPAEPRVVPAFVPPALADPLAAAGDQVEAPPFIPPQVVLQRNPRAPA